uniref:Uncharacterized protein n=1 Tax=Molossus molossus TaxID=27622 RepID=A0A7J8GLL9_MOLMO|nr:hypothetical protein HJG59_011407 [Molossus molossus]
MPQWVHPAGLEPGPGSSVAPSLRNWAGYEKSAGEGLPGVSSSGDVAVSPPSSWGRIHNSLASLLPQTQLRQMFGASEVSVSRPSTRHPLRCVQQTSFTATLWPVRDVGGTAQDTGEHCEKC